jgi:hypothetical protein
MAAPGAFPFMRLPGEIRNMIYRQVFSRETSLIIQDGLALPGPATNCGHLLAVCRAIHDEARPILWSVTTLVFRGSHGPNRAVSLSTSAAPCAASSSTTATPSRASTAASPAKA